MQQTKKFKMADAISPYLAVSCGFNTEPICPATGCGYRDSLVITSTLDVTRPMVRKGWIGDERWASLEGMGDKLFDLNDYNWLQTNVIGTN